MISNATERSRMLPICAALLSFCLFGSPLTAADLVEGSDVRAEPMKKALAAMVKEIDSGDLEKAKAEYAGDGDDLELLKAYVEGVAAAKTMRASVKSKFGEDSEKRLVGLDRDVARMAVHDFNSVIFLADPDKASSSADSPLGVGIEFKRVDGKWKVLSLASAPNTPKEHLARLQNYTSKIKTITEKLQSGSYSKAKEAASDARDAKDVLWPMSRKSAPPTAPTK